MLGMSGRAGFGSLDSGMKKGPNSSSGTIIGTATSSTAPHQKCSTSHPPKMGPRAAPPEKPAAQMATASRRRLGAGKMLRISGSRDGREPRRANKEQPTAPYPVAQASHRHQQSCKDERVSIHNPQELHAGG